MCRKPSTRYLVGISLLLVSFVSMWVSLIPLFQLQLTWHIRWLLLALLCPLPGILLIRGSEEGLTRFSRIASMVAPLNILIVLAIFVPAAPRSGNTPMNGCIVNQRQIAMAIVMYLEDHDEHLPPDLQALSLEPLTCRAVYKGGYGYNRHLANTALSNYQTARVDRLLLTADAKRADSLLASPEDIAVRHGKHRYVASFLDGHVESRFPADDKEIRWK